MQRLQLKMKHIQFHYNKRSAGNLPTYNISIDVERDGGEFIRFFGKITEMSEDKPTGKMIPKWAVNLAISHIIEFSSAAAA